MFAGTNEISGLLIKTDKKGDVVWNTTLFAFQRMPSDLSISNVAIASDGGYFVAYWLTTFNHAIGEDFTNLVLYKINSEGEIQFTKTFSYDASEGQSIDPALGGREIQLLQPKLLFMAQETAAVFLLEALGLMVVFSAPFIIKLDSQGNWEWNRSYANGVTVNAVFPQPSRRLITGSSPWEDTCVCHSINLLQCSRLTPMAIWRGIKRLPVLPLPLGLIKFWLQRTVDMRLLAR